MKNYLVLYDAGLCGTWLCYFSNLHEGFPNLRYEIKKPSNLDLVCPGADYFHQSPNPFLEQIEKKLQAEHCVEDINTALDTFRNSKFCFKIIPNHSLRLVSKWNKKRFLEVKNQIPNLEKIIIPYVDVHYADELRSRFMEIKKREQAPLGIDFDIRKWQLRMIKEKVYDDVGCDILPLDIGKILKYDDKEYKKLYNFLETRPLHNWKEYVKKYKDIAKLD